MSTRDAERRRELRRMRVIATGLLVLATLVYVVARSNEERAGWIGFVRAGAEAAMVGALADWFAVTALFRRPLGLPIPHTAIIPANKDRIGRSLGEFVQEHFLAAAVLEDRLLEAQPSVVVGRWLAEPANAVRVSETATLALSGVADLLDDERAVSTIEAAVLDRLRATPAAPIVAHAIDVAVDRGHHRALVDSFLRAAGGYLEDNRDSLRDRLRNESPWWVPESIDDRVFEKVLGGAKRFLADLAADPQHELRRALDQRLVDLAAHLRTDPELQARLEDRKIEVLEHPSVRAWAGSLWAEGKVWVATSSRDPESLLRVRAAAFAAEAGERLRDDPELGATFDRWVTRAAVTLADQYGSGAADFIASTVERWDIDETSSRLELQVGKDLQYIRINGTVVGALAGLAIHAIGQHL